MLESRIRNLLEPLADGVDFAVERPKQEGHGDYATNLALVAAKQQGKNPRELAEGWQAELAANDLFSAVEVAGPGFLNFTMADTVLAASLADLLENDGLAPVPSIGAGKKVVIEYSDPNIAKRFSIGHLRSTIIGQAVVNLHQAAGWDVVTTNHLGDWGTQFGKMIVAIRRWTDKPAAELSIEELEQLYIKFHDEAERNSTLDDEARATFVALEQGDQEVRQLWKVLVASSMIEFNRLYGILGTTIEHQLGESDYQDRVPKITDLLVKRGIAQESNGALIVPFPNDQLPPAMVRKSDGASTYFARDLGTIEYRNEHWKPDHFIYEVGSEQELYFKQLFYAAELLGWGTRADYTHVKHGLVRLPDGKMSTRKGRTIKLEAVLEEAVVRAAKLNDDPEVSKMVGIGAVKYNDLKRDAKTGYVFEWDEMLTLEGNSGPYIQYVHARAQAILRKMESTPAVKVAAGLQLEEAERELLKALFRFGDVVAEATAAYAPHILSTYLFDLTQKFNRFYEQCPVLKAEPTVRDYRLAIISSTAATIKAGLNLLGIEAPDRM